MYSAFILDLYLSCLSCFYWLTLFFTTAHLNDAPMRARQGPCAFPSCGMRELPGDSILFPCLQFHRGDRAPRAGAAPDLDHETAALALTSVSPKAASRGRGQAKVGLICVSSRCVRMRPIVSRPPTASCAALYASMDAPAMSPIGVIPRPAGSAASDAPEPVPGKPQKLRIRLFCKNNRLERKPDSAWRNFAASLQRNFRP
jgi:hypothetical protein